MIWSSLAYLRKKWLARKSEKKDGITVPVGLIREKCIKMMLLWTQNRERNRKRFEKEMGTKMGRIGWKKILCHNLKLRSWSTHICSISFGLGPFFYHSLLWSECLINSGMNKTIPHKTNYHGTDNSRYSVDGTGVLISDNWQFIRRLVESTKIFIN